MGFLIIVPVIAAGFAIAIFSLTLTGASLVIIGVGIPIAIFGLYLSRWFGTFERFRLELTGRTSIEGPYWRGIERKNLWGSVRNVLLGADYWRYLAHVGIYQVVGTVTTTLTLTWVAIILGGSTYWFWSNYLPVPQNDLASLISQALNWQISQVNSSNIINAALAVFCLMTLPLLTRSLVDLHHWLARILLGKYSVAQLEGQVAGLEESRAFAIAAEGRSVRKLERDLHDGPQQQLVRLQFDLAEAERKMHKDPEAAAIILEAAKQRNADALAELRSLSRGFAPPLLQDRGLAEAVRSLAEQHPLPVDISINLANPRLEQNIDIEQNAYFVISELLTNTLKHSAATEVWLTLSEEHSPEVSKLVITLRDNGVGGAAPTADHGLAGIGERIHGLGGIFELTSPAGGPTEARITVPLKR